MPIDFDQLRGDNTTVDHPNDGAHQARLHRAVLRDTRNGECLVTEWADETQNVQWESWNRFDTNGLAWTRELLLGLKIDLATITDTNELEFALAQRVGQLWDVTTKSNQGSQGDRWFVNTYVNGKSVGVQETLNGDADVPIDSGGLPAAKDELDEIPF